MYTAIHLEGKELGKYKSIGDAETFGNLSRINILIGRNNSGKSRFLRQLFSFDKLEYKSTQINLEDYASALSSVRSTFETLCLQYHVESIKELPEKLFSEINFINIDSDIHDRKSKLLKPLSQNSSITPIHKRSSSYQNYVIKDVLRSQLSGLVKAIPSVSSKDITNSFRKTIYIPALRGLRGFSLDNSETVDFYKDRTVQDYFEKSKIDESSVYTGLSLYNDVKKLLLGPTNGRKKIKRFEEFLSKSFFEGDDVNIIPNIEDNVVHVKIGDKEEYPIYELGDGIQAIIILTYPLFFRQGEPLNICIEEPDLFLHPGFQRVFIQTLCDPKFKSFQFFFTTHSNHFLDMTLDFKDISVYCFSKLDQDKFEIENVSNANDKVLEEIGVRNSSVFLSNCTIWVEGITDRIYIRKYLELYLKSNKALSPVLEDVHYSYVEYGGGNITHWSFLDDADSEHPNINVERLCGKIFLVADKDGTTSKGTDAKSLRIAALKDELGNRFYCLECREIENLLTKEIRFETVKKLEKQDTELELNSAKGVLINKTPIGTWIHTKIDGIKRSYKADSGTVKDKVSFAKAAVGSLSSFDDLSPEAQELTKKVYDFIIAQND